VAEKSSFTRVGGFLQLISQSNATVLKSQFYSKIAYILTNFSIFITCWRCNECNL